jgi:hypothetical protein
MSENKENLDPQMVARVRRRMGFITILWWVAAAFGSVGVGRAHAQGQSTNLGRLLLVAAAWMMALFFSYAWLQVRKGTPQ